MGVITLSIVFLALSGIALIIYGVKYLVPILDSASRKPKAPVQGVPVIEKTVQAVPAEGGLSAEAGEEEIVAAISAVVAVMTAGKGRVVAVRPVPTGRGAPGSAWKLSGRLEGLEGF
jgi:hypothetical protein